MLDLIMVRITAVVQMEKNGLIVLVVVKKLFYVLGKE